MIKQSRFAVTSNTPKECEANLPKKTLIWFRRIINTSCGSRAITTSENANSIILRIPEEAFPVIATTSELMTTGIDAQTVKVIVLDKNINSMTNFKQIIGRGTRINEEYNKHFFTILDFRNATDLFADTDFDGDPIRVKPVSEDDDLTTILDEEETDETPIIDEETGEEITIETADNPQPGTTRANCIPQQKSFCQWR